LWRIHLEIGYATIYGEQYLNWSERFNKVLSNLLRAFPLFVLSLLFACSSAVYSQDEDDEIETEIDWAGRFTHVVDIRTEALANYLRNSRNSFDNLILARINTRSPAENKSSKYEVLWYRKGDPVGLRRLGGLSFRAPQKIALHVIHANQPAGDDDVKAAANVCLRLYLELYGKGMAPSAIVVPRQSFNSFVQRMNQLNFYSAEEPEPNQPVRSSIVLAVESEPPALRQLLFYSGQRF